MNFTCVFVLLTLLFPQSTIAKAIIKNPGHATDSASKDQPDEINERNEFDYSDLGSYPSKLKHAKENRIPHHIAIGILQKKKREEENGVDDGLALNSDPIRPALSLEDRANLMRIQSYIKAIHSQLDDIKTAQRPNPLINGKQINKKMSKTALRPEKNANKRKGVTVPYPIETARGINDADLQMLTSKRSTWPYMGFSPTSSPVKKPPTTSTSTSIRRNFDLKQSVKGRAVPGPNVHSTVKQYVTDSIVKTFGILKTSLIKIDQDVEQGFQKLYNLDTDHYNMANGDIRSNGDKIERLQKYLTNELYLTRSSLSSMASATLLLSKTLQRTMEKLLNAADSIMNITKIMNDRTERIADIEDKKVKMAVARLNCKKHKGLCFKHGITHKHSHGLKIYSPLLTRKQQYSSIMDYIKRKQTPAHARKHHKTKSTRAKGTEVNVAEVKSPHRVASTVNSSKKSARGVSQHKQPHGVKREGH